MPTATTVISKRFDELTARELHDLLRLRIDVFVVEQVCPYHELDGRDVEPGTEHHWITGSATRGRIRSVGPDETYPSPSADDRDAVVVYARTLDDGEGTTRIGRVVTAPAARGAGLAAGLMTHLVDRFGDRTLVLDAQSHLGDWYRRFGFEPAGDEFVEDGIPHVPMRRT